MNFITETLLCFHLCSCLSLCLSKFAGSRAKDETLTLYALRLLGFILTEEHKVNQGELHNPLAHMFDLCDSKSMLICFESKTAKIFHFANEVASV